MMTDNGWLRLHLESISDRLGSMETRLEGLERSVAGLRARAQMWGFLAGVIPGLVAAAVGAIAFWRK